MGTLARITAQRATDAAVQLAFARLRDLERCLSDYLPDSELNRATAEAAHRPVQLSPDLQTVLAYAQRIAVESNGAFDVTAGPLIRLWRQARRDRRLPSPADLAAARALSGFRLVTLRGGLLSLPARGMQLDLGGIAKGYAAGEACRLLRSHGTARALVAIAGDVVAGEGKWRVAIEHAGRLVRTVTLSRQAVSTSGDAEQFVQIEGVRYSHIVDPRTGLGLTGAPSVSVIAPSGMEADALATAVSVGGEQILRAHPRARAIVTPARS
jgi:FAD:protein FMN transferase